MTASYHRNDPHKLARPHHVPALPQVALEITRGAAQQRLRNVTGPAFLIGTAADCDLVLGDGRLPSVHTCLLCGPQGVTIRHLGFDPELLINGEHADCVMLSDGDRIGLGRFEFRVHIQGGRPASDRDGQSSWSGQPRSTRRQPDDSARVHIRDLLAEIRRLETPPITLRLFVGAESPAPLPERQARMA